MAQPPAPPGVARERRRRGRPHRVHGRRRRRTGRAARRSPSSFSCVKVPPVRSLAPCRTRVLAGSVSVRAARRRAGDVSSLTAPAGRRRRRSGVRGGVRTVLVPCRAPAGRLGGDQGPERDGGPGHGSFKVAVPVRRAGRQRHRGRNRCDDRRGDCRCRQGPGCRGRDGRGRHSRRRCGGRGQHARDDERTTRGGHRLNSGDRRRCGPDGWWGGGASGWAVRGQRCRHRHQPRVGGLGEPGRESRRLPADGALPDLKPGAEHRGDAQRRDHDEARDRCPHPRGHGSQRRAQPDHRAILPAVPRAQG